PHVYWAAGGTAALPDGESVEGALAVVNYAAIALTAVAAVLALALVRPWGAALPRSLLLVGAWTACVLLGLRGGGGLLQGALGASDGTEEGQGLVLVFEGLFLLGGILFGLAASQYARTTAPVGG
ncbi:MAG: DUF3995 domain-containing protein, partial [Actinomycetota bacterium]|nr:DUF3995 domain-containing protein [Actinomycetota bacterium]